MGMNLTPTCGISRTFRLRRTSIPTSSGKSFPTCPIPGWTEARTRSATKSISTGIFTNTRPLALWKKSMRKRGALITRAVTRGLDPKAPLHGTGIPWLGQTPAHWAIVPLRFLVEFSSGTTPDTGNSASWEGSIPWVSPKDMKRDEIDDAQDLVSPKALSGSALRLNDPGAVLIVVRGMILAHRFPTAVNTKRVAINQDMKALWCRSNLQPYFLRDFFRGTAQHIVSLTDSSAHGTRKVETERTISLSKKRCAALITAAVTGQIDVSNSTGIGEVTQS